MSGQVLITARVRNETAEGTIIINRAAIGFSTTSGVGLPGKTTNEVSTVIGAPRAPNMTVAMQADRTVVGWNDTVNFSVGYDNTGDGPALYAVLAAELPSGMTLVTSSAEGSRAATTWIFQSVPAGPHGLTFTVMIGSGIANNTVLTGKITLNYADPRAGPMPSSQASVSITVISGQVLPPPTKPTIINREPGPGATDVPTDTAIVVTFSSPMNRSTIPGAFSVSPGVQGSFSWSGNALVFTPAKKLETGKRYTVSVTTGARDEGGNPLDQTYSWSFTTRTKAPAATENMPWTLIIILLVCIIALACLAALALRRKGGGKSPEETGAPPSVASAPAQPLPRSDGIPRTGGQTYSTPDKDVKSPMPMEEKAEPPKAAAAAPMAPVQVQWGEEPKPEAHRQEEGKSVPSKVEEKAQEPSGPVRANPEKKAVPDADIEALMNRLKQD
jgi:uncharacterized repeat protein (TIGR01451 family)